MWRRRDEAQKVGDPRKAPIHVSGAASLVSRRLRFALFETRAGDAEDCFEANIYVLFAGSP
jgi:predicted RecA/RadA family phage recombinase